MNNVEKFCLRWNEFETNIRESFREMREDQNHFDVTLATDDGHQVQTHKMILSAGSKFFKNILRKTNHPSPFIYLKGINRVELEYVVDFLYNTEICIAQEEVTKFLETAQELQIKGLQSNREDESDQNKTVKTESDVEPNFTEEHFQIYEQTQDLNQLECRFDPLEEVADNQDINSDVTFNKPEEDDLVLNTNIGLDLQIEQIIEKKEGLWQCKVCGKTARDKRNTRLHAEIHIKGVSHICHICNKTLRTRDSLRVHIRNYHSELSFTCNICGETGMNKMAYKGHKSTCKVSAMK